MPPEVTSTPALPHSCACGARWGGANTSHCGSCHLTFSAVGPFDLHRRGGACLLPADAGLQLVGGRPYDCWGQEFKPGRSWTAPGADE